MSFFSNLFGSDGKKSKKKASSTEDTQNAIQQLRTMEETLIKKQAFFEKKIEAEHDKAKKNATKNKRIALQALKTKKRYEANLAKIDGTLTTIEYQRDALENANTNNEVLQTMAMASAAMKKAHSNMDIDEVNYLMDDIQESHEVAKEISDAISNPIGFGQDVDEDELADELERLGQEDLDEQLVNIAAPVQTNLPDVPNAEPKRPAKQAEAEDDELKELEAWAS